MRKCFLILIVFLLALMSCAFAPPAEIPPEPVQTEARVEAAAVEAEPEAPALAEPKEPVFQASAGPGPAVEEEPAFDPSSISEEVFVTTKAEIQRIVENLNKIIRAGNYNAWLTCLGEGYKRKINSREFLESIIARYPVFRGRIKNSRDYFSNVVIPSRVNDRVDDIEFISTNEVKAYSEDSKGQIVVLYYLENLDGTWKISN